MVPNLPKNIAPRRFGIAKRFNDAEYYVKTDLDRRDTMQIKSI